MALQTGVGKLNRFLETVRGTIASSDLIQCVIGNEAADLDSMASAVLYAYSKAHDASADSKTTYVPVINVPREDFKLRTEAVYLFQEAGVNPQWLIFSDEIDLASLKMAGKLKIALIDHNRLASVQESLTDCVTEIIDHHKDENLFASASPRVIEPVGSAATLVAEIILNQGKDLLDEGSAKLLLGTILLDTVNLDPEAKRATPKDQQIVDKLLALTGVNRQQMFDKLQAEKFNVSALDTSDLLRKDYKEWKLGAKQVGFASVLLPVAEWLKKDDHLSASLSDYAGARNLDVLIAMNAYTDPQFTRELVVYCPDEALRTRLLAFLTESDLQLSAIPSDSVDSSTALFAQGNLAYSRKKLQPLLDGFFAGLA
jgi:exopolyphosphatase